MNEANNVLTIKTVQIQPIRNMITAVKDILTDATITFTKEGMKIINFDKTHTILVNVGCANKFEYYNCEPEKIIVCANTLHLFKVILLCRTMIPCLCILIRTIIMMVLYLIWVCNMIMEISSNAIVKSCV